MGAYRQRTFYLAASFKDIEKARKYASRIETAKGLACTSSWLRGEVEGDSGELALLDIRDIKRADIVVVWLTGTISPGKHIEYGFCLGQGKVTYLLYERRRRAEPGIIRAKCVFYSLSPMMSWDEFLEGEFGT